MTPAAPWAMEGTATSSRDAEDRGPSGLRALALGPADAGSRMDLYLAHALGLSRAQARRLLARGAVSLDGRPLGLSDKGRPVPGAGRLEVAPFLPPAKQRARTEDSTPDAPIVLAEGPGWLALDKPAGMPPHPLDEAERGSALGHVIRLRPEVQGVGEGGLRSGVVHRLDVETSGVLLFATLEPTWRRLRAAFASHLVEKRYLAIVEGRFDPPDGHVDLALPLLVARHRPARVRVAGVHEQHRRSVRVVEQRVEVLELFDDASLVEVRPRTGFLHQIRATLAHLGHPLLGDARYGGDARRAAGLGARRHMLHAVALRFEEIAAESAPAADFAAVLQRLRA